MSERPVEDSTTPAVAMGGTDIGMRIVAEMLAGLLLYGGLGWLGDHFWHTSFLLPIGLLLGFGLSIYMVFRRFKGGDGEK